MSKLVDAFACGSHWRIHRLGLHRLVGAFEASVFHSHVASPC